MSWHRTPHVRFAGLPRRRALGGAVSPATCSLGACRGWSPTPTPARSSTAGRAPLPTGTATGPSCWRSERRAAAHFQPPTSGNFQHPPGGGGFRHQEIFNIHLEEGGSDLSTTDIRKFSTSTWWRGVQIASMAAAVWCVGRYESVGQFWPLKYESVRRGFESVFFGVHFLSPSVPEHAAPPSQQRFFLVEHTTTLCNTVHAMYTPDCNYRTK